MSISFLLGSSSRTALSRALPCVRSFASSCVAREADLQAALRAGLKTAMKGKDKPAVTVLKVNGLPFILISS
jgi:hypothetical protein